MLYMSFRYLRLFLYLLFLFCSIGVIEATPVCTVHEFKSGNEITNSRVSWFDQDKNGMLWMGMWNGLCRYDGRQFQFFRSEPGNDNPQSSNRLMRIELDSRQNFWCASRNSRLYLFDRKTSVFTDVFATLGQTYYVEKNRPSIFSLKPKGVTWVVLNDGSCLRFHDNDILDYDYLPTRPDGISRTESRRTVYDIYLDSQGREWILIDNGVMIYGRQLLSNYPFLRIHELNGRIFLVTQDGYLAEYGDDGALHFLDFPIMVKRIYSSFTLDNGFLAIGTDVGLLLYDVGSSTYEIFTSTVEGRLLAPVTYVYRDARRRLWLFTKDKGVYRLDAARKHLKWYSSPVEVNGKNEEGALHLIFEDASGELWMKPREGSLSWYDEESDCLRDYTDVLVEGDNDRINRYDGYFIDRQKNLWVASETTLFQFTFRQRQFLHTPTHCSREVRMVYCEEGQRFWYGDKDGRLFCRNLSDGKVLTLTSAGDFSEKPVLFSHSGIYCFLKDSNGNYWVGTRGDGLYRLRPVSGGKFAVDHYTKGSSTFTLSDNNVYALYEDEFHHLWVGTYGGGLNLVDRKAGDARFINKDNKLQNYPAYGYLDVRCIIGTGKGELLVGTTDGLITFTSVFSRPAEIIFYKQEKRFGDAASLPGNDIMQIIHIPEQDKIFVCAYGLGVSELVSENILSDSLCFETYLNRENPSGDVVISAAKDHHGRLWTVAEGSVSCFLPDQHKFIYFDKNDFDREYKFSEARPALFADGEIRFGTVDGYVAFNTDSLYKDLYRPELIFTAINWAGDLKSSMVNDLDTLVLPSHRRSVSISFAALDYRPSHLLRYAYKLDDVDEEWTQTDKPVVNYVNLPHGSYRLRVRSTNHDGQWCDNMRLLTIIVEPTFWETPFAWGMYVISFLLLVFLSVYIYMYIYKLRHRMDMEQKMAGVKLRFFTDISHELRTPLTLISGPLGEVLSQEPLSKQARSHLELAQKNTSRMLELVNQILDFRKLQNGHVRLTLAETDIVPLLRRVMSYYDDLARQKEIHYTLEGAPESLVLWLDTDKIEKIVFNLLSNAFKYTDSGKSVQVVLETSEEELRIKVADEGRGIEASRLAHVFDRFVSVSEGNEMQPSSGIGLSLVKELVQLHHASIKVDSEVGKGACFTLTVSRSRDSYEGDPAVDFIRKSEVQEHTPEGNVSVDDSVDKNEMATESESDEKGGTRKITILVVEDNAELRRFIVSILGETYRIREAENGQKGLEIVKREEIDFILTDIMMPVMDGMEMVRLIKGDPLICHIPIVVLTAKTSLDDRIEGLENGIDDYLVKPFSSSYLKSRVDNLIRQRQMLQQAFMASCLPDSRSASGGASVPQSVELQMPQVVDYDREFIGRVMEFFERNMSNVDLAVEDFADALNMSRTSFYRKVKAVIGLSPVDFIRQIRIKRAVQFINAGEESLSQIAYKVGFSDPKYFSKCFKRDMGMPPLEYKQKVIQSRKNDAEALPDEK